MDYKYIEQLLERYWQCETTLQEEAILRSFFSQEDVPVWLVKYKTLFQVTGERVDALGDDFDQRILSLIDSEQQKGRTVKARTVTLTQRLMPLFKAAAVVAIVLTLGNAAQAPWEWGYSDPKAELQAQQQDSILMDEPVQAEILKDTAQTMTSTLPKY